MPLPRSLFLVLTTGVFLGACESTPSSSPLVPQMTVAPDVSPASPETEPGSPETEKDRQKRLAWTDALDGLRFEHNRIVVEAPVAVDDLETSAAHLDRGLQTLKSNRRTESVRWFRRAAQAAPGSAEPFYQLGRAFITKGKLDLAHAALATALDCDPGHQAAQIEQAETFARQSRLVDAIASMSMVADRDPTCGVAHQRLAVWNYYAGHYDVALSHVSEAAALGTPAPPQLVELLRRNEP